MSRLEKIDRLAGFYDMKSLTPERIRNLAIIAHADHGKTTLVWTNCSNNRVAFAKTKSWMIGRWIRWLWSRAWDHHQSEERFRTLGEYLVNIVDTPGHADFGGEVERVMKMVDGYASRRCL